MQEEPFELKCLRPGQTVFYNGQPVIYTHHYFNPNRQHWVIIVESYYGGIRGSDHIPYESLSFTIPRSATC